MIFYHVSRPHHSLGPHAPNLVRAAATTDQEYDGLTSLAVHWTNRPQPSVKGSAPVKRAQGTPSPSIYIPTALHQEIPTELLIAEHEIQVADDLRTLNRVRWRRDFLPHYHGSTMARLRFALPGVTNHLLRHACLQFLRAVPLTLFPDIGIATAHLRDQPPNPTVLAPDGTVFDPATGEVLD